MMTFELPFMPPRKQTKLSGEGTIAPTHSQDANSGSNADIQVGVPAAQPGQQDAPIPIDDTDDEVEIVEVRRRDTINTGRQLTIPA